MSYKVQREMSVTPVIIVDDFLSEEKAAAVLEECIGLKRIYIPAKVLDGKQSSILNEKFRKNTVVYLDNVFGEYHDRSSILKLVLREGIFSKEAMEVWREDNTGFEMLTRCTRSETVLSRYGEGDFYDYHRDYNFNKANRLITAVYYCNQEPAKFKGGKLILKVGEKLLPLEPKHNRLVVFNSGAYHAVEHTILDGDKFEDGRFSVNMWLGFQN